MTVSVEITNTGNCDGDCVFVADATTDRRSVWLQRGGVIRLGLGGEVTLKLASRHGTGDFKGEIETVVREKQQRLEHKDLFR